MARSLSLCLSLAPRPPVLFSPFLFLAFSLLSSILILGNITTSALPRVHNEIPLDLHLDFGLIKRAGAWTSPRGITDAGLSPVTSDDPGPSESQIASAVTVAPSSTEEMQYAFVILSFSLSLSLYLYLSLYVYIHVYKSLRSYSYFHLHLCIHAYIMYIVCPYRFMSCRSCRNMSHNIISQISITHSTSHVRHPLHSLSSCNIIWCLISRSTPLSRSSWARLRSLCMS